MPSLLGTATWLLAPDIAMTRLTGQEMPVFELTEAPNPIVDSYRTQTAAGSS